MTDRGSGYVAALLREREGYVRAGRADRVRAVDQELALLGVHVDDVPEAAVDIPPEQAVPRRPRTRKPPVRKR